MARKWNAYVVIVGTQPGVYTDWYVLVVLDLFPLWRGARNDSLHLHTRLTRRILFPYPGLWWPTMYFTFRVQFIKGIQHSERPERPSRSHKGRVAFGQSTRGIHLVQTLGIPTMHEHLLSLLRSTHPAPIGCRTRTSAHISAQAEEMRLCMHQPQPLLSPQPRGLTTCRSLSCLATWTQ